MKKKGPELEGLDVFKIMEELEEPKEPEEPEEAVNGTNYSNVEEKLELLKAEILKLGKAQIQARMFAKSEYRAIHEAIETFSAGNNHVAEPIIEDLFSIADGLEAGIRAGKAVSNPEMDSWLDGMRMVYQRVMELLEKFDVHPVYSVGKLFDPSLHTAVAVEHMQAVDDNVILEEQRCGYIYGDKVIRYAEVIVNKQPREPAVQMEKSDE